MNLFTQLVVIVGRVTPSGVTMLGTAFAVNSKGLFATTRHVVGSQDADLVILAPHVTDINAYQDLSDTTCLPIKASIAELHPLRDLALVKADVTFGGTVPPLGGFDNTAVGDEVLIYGFPHCVEGRRALTFQRSYVGAKVLLRDEGLISKHAVINTQARPGQSGSLVFSPKQQSVSGVLVGAWVPAGGGISLGGINPRELHQTTHCISAEHVQEML
jgi:trypsin-like peptidase